MRRKKKKKKLKTRKIVIDFGEFEWVKPVLTKVDKNLKHLDKLIDVFDGDVHRFVDCYVKNYRNVSYFDRVDMKYLKLALTKQKIELDQLNLVDRLINIRKIIKNNKYTKEFKNEGRIRDRSGSVR